MKRVTVEANYPTVLKPTVGTTVLHKGELTGGGEKSAGEHRS